MLFWISCTAPFDLPEQGIPTYVHFNDEVSLQELNRKCKETTHVALAHPHDPGVPGLSAQCQRTVPAQRSRTGRYWPRSCGHSARCSRKLQQLILFGHLTNG